MDLNVLISSCARPDVLETSIRGFRRHIKTTCNLRYVILEDKVDDEKRQNIGRQWLNDYKNWFDEIHYSEKRMGPGYYWAPLVKLCKSDYFFHLDDDSEIIVDIDLDKLINVMKKNKDMTEIILRRGMTDPRNHPKSVRVDGLKLTQFDLFSNSTGMFNTKLSKDIIDVAGWKTQLREVQVLGRISRELNLKNYTLGYNNNQKHYEHIGAVKGYKKGSWKNE